MTEEPYRWLEAIANRREYVGDQIASGSPVFAVSRPEGVLLFGVGTGQSKVFEIYDRHAFAAVGHPVDIEKLRQSAIEAAHLEGFNRSPQDVTLRRLVNFALSQSLKNAFEQIFSPPIMVESIFAEVGDRPEQDLLARIHFDGRYHYATKGMTCVIPKEEKEAGAEAWLLANLKPEDTIPQVMRCCLSLWKSLMENKSIPETVVEEQMPLFVEGKTLEIALLRRDESVRSRFQLLDAASLQK